MKKLAKINPLITVAVTFVIILVTQLIFFTIRGKDQFQLLTDQIEKYQHNEILLENNIRLLNDKANEVRSILSLPEIVLNQSNTDNDSKINENINDNLPFYNAIDFIQVYSDKTSMENMLHILLTSGRMNENLNSLGFIIKKTGSSSYNFFRSNSLYFNIKAENPESPSISIKSFTGNTKNFLLKEILTDDTETAEFINDILVWYNDMDMIDLSRSWKFAVKKQLIAHWILKSFRKNNNSNLKTYLNPLFWLKNRIYPRDKLIKEFEEVNKRIYNIKL